MAQLNLSGTGTGASIGTAIMPGIGTAIGAGLGAIFDIGSWLSGQSAQDNADILQAKSDALNYKTAALETGVAIEQAKSDISAYETFLSAFPNYADLQKNTFEASSRSEFKGLLENFGSTNVAAGVTGRSGGSAGLVSKEYEKELDDYAGIDKTLGGEGGRYQMAKTELLGNLTAEEKQATNQLGILKTSLGTLDETLGLYNEAAASAEARVKSETKAAKTWWNPFD